MSCTMLQLWWCLQPYRLFQQSRPWDLPVQNYPRPLIPKPSHHFYQFWGAKHSRQFWVPNTAIASSSSGVPNTAIGFTSSGMSNDSALGFTSSEIHIKPYLLIYPPRPKVRRYVLSHPWSQQPWPRRPLHPFKNFLILFTIRTGWCISLPGVVMVVTAICCENHYLL